MVTEVIKSGYKKTDIGVIPDDWDLISFGDAFDFLSTASYSRSQLGEDQNILYVHYGDIHTKWKHFLDVSKESLPSIDNAKLKSYSLIKKGDLIIADASEDYEGICKSVEVRNIGSKEVISGLHTFLLRSKKDIFVNGFKGYISSNKLVKTQFDRLATGLKVYGLSKTNLKVVLIPYPKGEEQKTIFQVLSDMDNLIGSLNKLIRKKRNIKKGVMQQLLTGKKRLPSFSGEWESKKLKELIQIPVTDGPHSTPKFLKNGIPFLSVNNIVDNRIDLSDLRHISLSDHKLFSRKCKPQKGDILLGKAATVGTVAIVDLDFEFNIWSPLALIRISNKNIPKFFYYCLQTPILLNQVKFFTNSSSQGNIGMGDIEKLDFLFPSKEEQLAISKIFSDMDVDIEELERKRDKYKIIKEGMMQQLLTGTIRLR